MFPTREEQKHIIEESEQGYISHGSLIYLINKEWYIEWNKFVDNQSRVIPGEITNDKIYDKDEIKGIKKDLSPDEIKYVREETWSYFLKWYGGGPAISTILVWDEVRNEYGAALNWHTVTYHNRDSIKIGEQIFHEFEGYNEILKIGVNFLNNFIEKKAAEEHNATAGLDKKSKEGQEKSLKNVQKEDTNMETKENTEKEEDEEDEIEVTRILLYGDDYKVMEEDEMLYQLHIRENVDFYIDEDWGDGFKLLGKERVQTDWLDDEIRWTLREGQGRGKGLTGIANVGNTCYAGSVLQCLLHTKPLKKYLKVTDSSLDAITTSSDEASHGEILLHEMYKLQTEIWSGDWGAVGPGGVLRICSRKSGAFGRGEQEDAHQFLVYVLGQLEEESESAKIDGDNDIKKTKEKHKCRRGDSEHPRLKANSVIEEIFGGEVRNHQICPGCGSSSVRYDYYNCLSIPVGESNNGNKKTVSQVKIRFVPKSFKEERKSFDIYAPDGIKGYNLSPFISYKIGREVCVTSGALNEERRELDWDSDGLSGNIIYSFEVDKEHIDSCFVAVRIIGKYYRKIVNITEPFLVQVDKGSNLTETCCKKLSFLWNDEGIVYMECNRFDNLSFGSGFDGGLPLRIRDVSSRSLAEIELNYDYMGCDFRRDIIVKQWSETEKFERAHKKESNAMRGKKSNDSLKFIRNNTRTAPKMRHSSPFNFQYNVPTKQMIVPPTDQTSNVSSKLIDCIRRLVQDEVLDDSNRWECPKCGCSVNAYKKVDIWSLPKVLIFHLKRFKLVDNAYQKDVTPVEIPEILDMRDFVYKENYSVKYRLFGVVEHIGTINMGHYIAKVKVKDKWYMFNDSTVVDSNFESIDIRNTYLLFYEKENNIFL